MIKAVVFLFTVLALAQAIIAQPVQKRHAHNHKRDVVYVTTIQTVNVVTEVVQPAATDVVIVDQFGNPISTEIGSSPTTSSPVYVAPVYVAPTTSSTPVYVAPTTSSTPVYVAPTTSSTPVYVAPTTSSTPVYVAPTSSSTPVYVAPTSSSTPVYVAPTTSSTPVYVAPTSSFFTSTTSDEQSSSTTSSSSSSSSTSASFSGSKGISYSPYTDDGGCKDASTVASEVSQLSSYAIIRLYGIDCDQVSNVLAAIAPGQKLFVGIYDIDDLASQVSLLASVANGWDDIYTVSIGNEPVNSGAKTADEMVSIISNGRSLLQAAGYSGPVVGVDTFIAVINNPVLCGASDYIAVNCHTFFDGGYTADQSGEFVQNQIKRVTAACNNDNILITESGWPTQGNSNGLAVPSVPNQDAALKSLRSLVADQLFEFTMLNDMWKSPGQYGIEQYWGIFDA
ncbi:glycoside hydrolase superfamily [Dipodascopsis uninucleata]